ncbi:GYF domain-containing protein [Gemmata sp.]|uniref:GYF domain-containing protein n=1 Tax=Gemmata sp. TaxID=1914242 RepID=UPI003F71F185
MAEATWYVAAEGGAAGPFDLARLKQMAAAGALARGDLVYPAGGSEWVTAATVPGLFPPPPPLPGGPRGLVPCARCGARVSDEARTCPQCGHAQPAAEADAPGKRGAKCGGCGTFNLVSDGFGLFSYDKCRGCGRWLRETNPDEFLDAEMERVYENSVTAPGLTAVLWALPGAFLLSCTGVLPKAPNGHNSPTALLVTIGLLYLGLRAVLARAIRWTGSWDGLGTRSELAGRMRGRSWDAVAARYARARGAGGGRSRSGCGAMGLKIGAGLVLAVAGFSVYQAQFSQYALGRKAGVQAVREASAKGVLVRAGLNFANVIDLIPTDPKASADWNAGFRAGFQEELERMYPPPRGR